MDDTVQVSGVLKGLELLRIVAQVIVVSGQILVLWILIQEFRIRH